MRAESKLILSASGFSGRREERFHFAPLSPQSLFPIHSCPSEIGGEGGDARAAEVTRRSSSGESTRCFSPTVFDVQHHAEGRGGAGVLYHDEASLHAVNGAGMPYHDEAEESGDSRERSELLTVLINGLHTYTCQRSRWTESLGSEC